MGIRFDLDQIINQVGRDKGISKETLIAALESAVLSAAKKHFGHNRNIEATYSPELGEIEVLEFRTVVDKVTDDATQMSVEEARREFAVDCEIGEELGRKLDSADLGRIAAQTAKQVMIQKLRDIDRDMIFSEFRDRKGELVNGIVQRFERGNIIVNLGRTDAMLPEREQITKERYRQNDRVRAMILDIDPASRGPQVILTRSHPDFMRKLFELEVPEISEGIVEIKGVAREPGERAKIAVYSNDPSVDPLGACVGIKGSRVQAVVNELRGERIDIVTWTPDAPSFVARALSPAEVQRVVVDEDEHAMEVVVSDEHLSLAIGRKGQNVKLASKLTGWRIDVRSESVAEEETKRVRAQLDSIPEIGFNESELLFQEGYRTIREVANASYEELAAVEGIGPDRAASILGNARAALAKAVEDGDEVIGENDSIEAHSIESVILPVTIKRGLIAAGFKTVQSVCALSHAALQEATGFDEQNVQRVLDAAQSFLNAASGKAA